MTIRSMPNSPLETRLRAYLAAPRDAKPPSFVVVMLERKSFGGVPPALEARDIMIATADHVMNSLGGVFGYVHGPEISVLIATDREVGDAAVAVAAGEASAKATLLLGALASFGACWWCFPDLATVGEYFQWRYEVAQASPAIESDATEATQVAPWRRCGVALWWQQLLAPGLPGPMTRRIRVELELPDLSEYVALVQRELGIDRHASA